MIKNNSGFTLTEIAIVLAIFGLIIAGVFTLMLPVLTSAKINKAINELGEIVNNVAANSARRKPPVGAECIPYTDAESRRRLYEQRQQNIGGTLLFPDTMLYEKGGTILLVTPWTTKVTDNNVTVELCGRGPAGALGIGVSVKYNDIPGGAVCSEFAMRSAELISGAKLSYLSISGSDNLIDDGKIALGDIVKECGKNKNDRRSISWFFRLTN